MLKSTHKYDSELSLLTEVYALAPKYVQRRKEKLISFDTILQAFNYLVDNSIVPKDVNSRVYQRILTLQSRIVPQTVDELFLSQSNNYPSSSSKSNINANGNSSDSQLSNNNSSSMRRRLQASFKQAEFDESNKDDTYYNEMRKSSARSVLARTVQKGIERIKHDDDVNDRNSLTSSIDDAVRNRQLSTATSTSGVNVSTSGVGSSSSSSSRGKRYTSFDNLISSPDIDTTTKAVAMDAPPPPPPSVSVGVESGSSSSIGVIPPPPEALDMLNMVGMQPVDGSSPVYRRSEIGSSTLKASLRGEIPTKSQINHTETASPGPHYRTSSSDLAANVKVLFKFQKWMTQSLDQLTDVTHDVKLRKSNWGLLSYPIAYQSVFLYGASARAMTMINEEEQYDNDNDGNTPKEMEWLTQQVNKALKTHCQSVCFHYWRAQSKASATESDATMFHSRRQLRDGFEALMENNYRSVSSKSGKKLEKVSASTYNPSPNASLGLSRSSNESEDSDSIPIKTTINSNSSSNITGDSNRSVRFDEDRDNDPALEEDEGIYDEYNNNKSGRSRNNNNNHNNHGNSNRRCEKRREIRDRDRDGQSRSFRRQAAQSDFQFDGVSSDDDEEDFLDALEREDRDRSSHRHERHDHYDQYQHSSRSRRDKDRTGVQIGVNVGDLENRGRGGRNSPSFDSAMHSVMGGVMSGHTRYKHTSRERSTNRYDSASPSPSSSPTYSQSRGYSDSTYRRGSSTHTISKGRSVYRMSFGDGNADMLYAPSAIYLEDLTYKKLLFRKFVRKMILEPQKLKERKERLDSILEAAVDMKYYLRLKFGFKAFRRFLVEEPMRRDTRADLAEKIWKRPGVLKTIAYIRLPAYVRCFRVLKDFYRNNLPSLGSYNKSDIGLRRWQLTNSIKRWRERLYKMKMSRISSSKAFNEELINCMGVRLDWTPDAISSFKRDFHKLSATKTAGFSALQARENQANFLAPYITSIDWERTRQVGNMRRFIIHMKARRAVPVLYFNRFDFEISPGGGHYFNGHGKEIASNPTLAIQLGDSPYLSRHRETGGVKLAPYRMEFAKMKVKPQSGILGASHISSTDSQHDFIKVIARRTVQEMVSGNNWRSPPSFLLNINPDTQKLQILSADKANSLAKSPIDTMRRRARAAQVVRAMSHDRPKDDNLNHLNSINGDKVWRGRGISALYGQSAFGGSPQNQRVDLGQHHEFEPLRHSRYGPICSLALRHWHVNSMISSRLRKIYKSLHESVTIAFTRTALLSWRNIWVHVRHARRSKQRRVFRVWSSFMDNKKKQRDDMAVVRLQRLSWGFRKITALHKVLSQKRIFHESVLLGSFEYAWSKSATTLVYGDSINRRLVKLSKLKTGAARKQALINAGYVTSQGTGLGHGIRHRRNNSPSKRNKYTPVGKDVDQNNYVIISQLFRRWFDRVNTCNFLKESHQMSVDHHNIWIKTKAFEANVWSTRMEKLSRQVLLVRQNRFMLLWKGKVLSSKTFRLNIKRHFMAMRNKHLFNKYSRMFLQPVMKMLRHGFETLEYHTDVVLDAGWDLEQFDRMFWMRRSWEEWYGELNRRRNERRLGMQRFFRKLRFTFRLQLQQLKLIPRALSARSRFTFKHFYYRMLVARKLRISAEKHSWDRLARKGFAAMLVLLAERRRYLYTTRIRLGEDESYHLCRQATGARVRYVQIKHKLNAIIKRSGESRMRMAMHHINENTKSWAGGRTSSAPKKFLKFAKRDLSAPEAVELLKRISLFESYLTLRLHNAEALMMQEDHDIVDDEVIADLEEPAKPRLSRSDQVQSILSDLRKRSEDQEHPLKGTLKPFEKVEALDPTQIQRLSRRQKYKDKLVGAVAGGSTSRSSSNLDSRIANTSSGVMSMAELGTNDGAMSQVEDRFSTAGSSKAPASRIHVSNRVVVERSEPPRSKEPCTAVVRIFQGVTYFHEAEKRIIKKFFVELMDWTAYHQSIRSIVDEHAKGVYARWVFQRLRDTVSYGKWEKKLKKIRTIHIMENRLKGFRAQRSFVYTAMEYFNAASILRALKRWRRRARILHAIRLRSKRSNGFKKHRTLVLCMYRWRSAAFATDFAVTMNDMEEQMAILEAKRAEMYKKPKKIRNK